MRIWLSCLLVLLAAPASAQLSVVQAAKARHPTLAGNAAETLAANREIAAATGGGVYKKTTGSNCSGYSCDWICWSGDRGRDIWGDWENKATPAWPAFAYLEDTASRCELVTAPNPPPNPPPPSSDIAVQQLEELKQIHGLLALIAAQQGAQTAAIVEAVAQLKAEIARGIKVRF